MSNQLTKEQVREARLRAIMGGGGSSQSSRQSKDEGSSNQSNNHTVAEVSSATTVSHSPSASATISENEYMELLRIIYLGSNLATDEDMKRWLLEGFVFHTFPAFGLKQGHGGPCGILAVVQSEILKELLYPHENQTPKYRDIEQLLADISTEKMKDILVTALVNILVRVSSSGIIKIAHYCNLQQLNTEIKIRDWHHAYPLQVMTIHTNQSNFEHAKSSFATLLSQFEGISGCLLFLISVVLTKGIQEIKNDMDDPTSTLIGQFGHCNQELINLLLTSQATSNVFDRETVLNEYVMRGVAQPGDVGYLTYLEALRYTQVGSFYKMPKRSIWVVGAASHFTVLFSLNNEVNEMTEVEKLLVALQRSFKSIENSESGFIPAEKLLDALRHINSLGEFPRNPFLQTIFPWSGSDNAVEIAKLRGLLSIEDGLILWHSYWTALSQLMTGRATLDDLLLRQNQHGNTSSNQIHPTNQLHHSQYEDDEAYARRLQAEFDNPNQQQTARNFNEQVNFTDQRPAAHMNAMQIDDEEDAETAAALALSLGYELPAARQQQQQHHHQQHHPQQQQQQYQQQQTRERSDSEIARDLQAQFDMEDSNALNAFADLPALENPPPRDFMDISQHGQDRHASTQTQRQTPTRMYLPRSDSIAGEDAPAFTMFHFNGLKSTVDQAHGQLTRITLQKRSAADGIIGQPIPLETGGEQSILAPTHGDESEETILLQILRTRWAGCRASFQKCDP